jgi:hypothetical protein
MKTLIAALLIATASTSAFAKCGPNHMLDQIASTSDLAVKTLDNRYNVFMSYDVKKDKIFVVAEDQKTCKISSGLMTSAQIWDKYQISYEENLEGKLGEG